MINRNDFSIVEKWKKTVIRDDYVKHHHESDWYPQIVQEAIDQHIEDVYVYLNKTNQTPSIENAYSVLVDWIHINEECGVSITNQLLLIDYDKMLSIEDYLIVREWKYDNEELDYSEKIDNFYECKKELERYGIPYPNGIQIYRRLADLLRGSY